MTDIKDTVADLLKDVVTSGVDFVKEMDAYMEKIKAVSDETKRYLEELLDDMPVEEEPWRPKTNDKVWVWNPMLNEIYTLLYFDNTDEVYSSSSRLFNRGYIFRTEEEAIEAQKRDKYKRQFEAMGRPFKGHTENWYIAYVNNKIIHYSTWSMSYPGQVYFDTKEALESAIRIIGEGNFKKYVMGIEEDDVHV